MGRVKVNPINKQSVTLLSHVTPEEAARIRLAVSLSADAAGRPYTGYSAWVRDLALAAADAIYNETISPAMQKAGMKIAEALNGRVRYGYKRPTRPDRRKLDAEN